MALFRRSGVPRAVDLVLMEVQLSEMNGLEATRLIRGTERNQGKMGCILALTAHARPEDKEACLAGGMECRGISDMRKEPF